MDISADTLLTVALTDIWHTVTHMALMFLTAHMHLQATPHKLNSSIKPINCLIIRPTQLVELDMVDTIHLNMDVVHILSMNYLILQTAITATSSITQSKEVMITINTASMATYSQLMSTMKTSIMTHTAVLTTTRMTLTMVMNTSANTMMATTMRKVTTVKSTIT